MSEKPQLNRDQLETWAGVAKAIEDLPETTPEQSAQKQTMKQNYQDHFNQLMDSYDMPLTENPISRRALAPATALHAIDYGSGLVRTGINEPILAGVNAAKGNPVRPGDIGTRAARALNPFDRPALSNKEYMDMMGVGDLGKFEDPNGNVPTFTGKGALGLGLDTVENPAMLEGLAGLLKKGGAAALAEHPPIPAEVMREAEGNAKSAADLAPSQGFLDNAKQIPGQVANWVKDPLSELRDKLLQMRFRNADNAVQMGAQGGRNLMRPAPSQIFQDSGAKGITSNQIRQDARAIVNQNSAKIDAMTNDVAGITDDGIYRGVPSDIAANPDTHARTAMYPLYTQEQQLAERTPFQGKDAQAARAQIEDEFRTAAQGNPQLMGLVGQQVERAGVPETAESLTGQYPLFRNQPVPVTSTRPEMTIMTDDGYIRASRPAKTVTTMEGGISAEAPPASSDPLSVDEPYSLPQVSQMASSAQGKAATRKFYLSRDRFAPDSPQTPPASREALAAEGGLYAAQGQHLRGLQEDLMDQARPGLGGDVHRINQESSSLLEGMPYIDRPKPTPSLGAPTARSRSAFGGVNMMVVDKATDAAKLGAMAGYQALSNPWIRQGALPLARADMLQKYWDSANTPSYLIPPSLEDPNGTPGGSNPWGLLYKMAGKQ